MLRAQRWTKLVDLRIETGIIPISLRIVKQICAGYMIKSLRRRRQEDLNQEVLRCLQRRQQRLDDGDDDDGADAVTP